MGNGVSVGPVGVMLGVGVYVLVGVDVGESVADAVGVDAVAHLAMRARMATFASNWVKTSAHDPGKPEQLAKDWPACAGLRLSIGTGYVLLSFSI